MAKNKNQKKIINKRKLLLNSEGKLGRHLEQVRTGTGIHKSKKDYRRKTKHNDKIQEY